ncbi:uncharacterized protein LOC116194228 [Punica granatum]|uniref:Uncharacterized protein LOC116194228 n=2 Tax=Punica granatum TaxID=22663 RepID=A0A6P8C5Q4_PUNGR|nr:uncharacterized protein LOC116194228 [Punica granatum]
MLPGLKKKKERMEPQPRPRPTPLSPRAHQLTDFTQPDWKHDVFVSFRGEDTRKGFVSHLFHALLQADIRCYRDVDQAERGKVVGPMLISAIHHSRIAIIIFSTNYADSKWCLQELVEILKCNKMYRHHGHMLIPIFYNVEPSEVRNQSGKFGEGFNRSQAKDQTEKEAWRVALREAGTISSWHVDHDARDEAEFIGLVVDHLSKKVFFLRSPYFTKNAVGLDHNVGHLISMLNIEKDDVRMVGIYGMEGIGKTAIAKAICGRLSNKFEGVSLLKDIRHADEKHKLVKLQKQLLQDILKIKQVMLSDRKNHNLREIRTRLSQKKILLVLDNLDKKKQTFFFTGEQDFLGPGSRILITTRDEQLLDDLGVHEKFMVPGLNPQDSLQLFCHHAFDQGNPKEGYEELSRGLVHYAGGIPSVIETFTDFLSGKVKDEWYQILQKLVKNPCLDSLGVYLTSISPIVPFKSVGPCGGSGTPFDDGAHTTVRKISVVFDSVIHSITLEYDDDGSLVRSRPHGGWYSTMTSRLCQVALDYPNEFLISISGYIEENYRFRVIRSLRFHSNRRMYGPFGEEMGTAFTIPPVDEGMIIGFFGNCDEVLDSIGTHFGPVPHPYPFNSITHFDRESETWDDKKHMDIRKISVVSSASVIESISVLYDNYGHPLGPFTHGRAEGGEKHTIKLDYPYEYLTSISEYIDEVSGKERVRSLTFQSNKRKYGPFGEENGRHFPVQWNSGKIVGFFGTVTYDSQLESIRAHLEPVSHIHPFGNAGPFGDEGGHQWDDGNNSNLRKIVLSWGRVINSIWCVYEKDGIIVEGLRHGGTSGSNEFTIELDYTNGEYISMLSGYYGKVEDVNVIISLRFQSNFRPYGPFGEDETRINGTFFRTPWNIGMINGFYGRSGRRFLNAIGAHFAPVYHKLPLKAIGPFGDDSRHQWDDGKHTGIRQINLRIGCVLDSIKFIYGDNENVAEGSYHGGDGGIPREIKFDYPDEYLKSISGHIGQLGSHVCVRSLTLGTNRRKIGPFGSEDGTPFSFTSNNGKIVGFSGSNSAYLHSIGMHVELFSDDQPIEENSLGRIRKKTPRLREGNWESHFEETKKRNRESHFHPRMAPLMIPK